MSASLPFNGSIIALQQQHHPPSAATPSTPAPLLFRRSITAIQQHATDQLEACLCKCSLQLHYLVSIAHSCLASCSVSSDRLGSIRRHQCSLCSRFGAGKGRAAWESALLQLTTHVYASHAELADAMLCMLWEMFSSWGLAGGSQAPAEQDDSVTGSGIAGCV